MTGILLEPAGMVMTGPSGRGCQMVVGFCGDVRLIASDWRIDYVYTVQKFAPDYSSVEVEVTAEAFAPAACRTAFKVRIGESAKSSMVELQPGMNLVKKTVRIEHALMETSGHEHPVYPTGDVARGLRAQHLRDRLQRSGNTSVFAIIRITP